MNSVQIASPSGGVMTDEVGAVTGDLVLSVRVQDGATAVSVAYVGSSDEYTVTGSPLGGRVDLDEVRVRLTTDPGVDGDGNALATSLT